MANAELCRHLLEHSVRTGNFTLKSGRTSTWFIDAKQTACRPEGIVAIADAMLAVLPDDIDAIGGLTLGADPVAYGVAAIAAVRGRSLRSFTIRKEAKDHGVAGRLAGALLPGDRVAITEDCVTRGTSPLEAADVVAAARCDTGADHPGRRPGRHGRRAGGRPGASPAPRSSPPPTSASPTRAPE